MGFFGLFKKKDKQPRVKDEPRADDTPKVEEPVEEPIVLHQEDWHLDVGFSGISMNSVNGINMVLDNRGLQLKGTLCDQFGNYYDKDKNLIIVKHTNSGVSITAGPNVSSLSSLQICGGNANFDGPKAGASKKSSSNASQRGDGPQKAEIGEEARFSINDFCGLKVEVDSSNVFIDTTSSNEAIVKFVVKNLKGTVTKEAKINKNKILRVTLLLNGTCGKSEVHISLPRHIYQLLEASAYAGDIKGDLDGAVFSNYDVKTSSGNIELSCDTEISAKELTANGIRLKADSGNIAANICVSNGNVVWPYGKVDVKTSSGNIEETCLDANAANISSMAGDIELNRLRAKQASIETCSGDIQVQFVGYVDASLNLKSDSGDIELSTENVSQIVRANGKTINTGKAGVVLNLSVKKGAGDFSLN